MPSFHPRLAGNRAFIAYWPPAENSTKLKLAVKDNIDVQGVVTTAGSKRLARNGMPAANDAACLAIARLRNVQIVGKANLSEFAVAPSGFNEYFGTPASPLDNLHKLLPGGSSCGSAVAVASGMADVAFGTDTAGSVRVPAAWCGVVGLKTTRGLVSLDGVFPIEPEHLDTVGPMGKDIAHTMQGMDLLLNGFAGTYAIVVAAKPSSKSIRVGRLTLSGTDPKIDRAVDEALARTGFKVVPLDDRFREKWEQARADGNAIAAAGAWISDNGFRRKLGVSARTPSRQSSPAGLPAPNQLQGGARETSSVAADAQRGIQESGLHRSADGADAPAANSAELENRPVRSSCAPTGKIRWPSILQGATRRLALPIPLHDDEVAVTSLQLIGPRLSEAELLNAGRLVEAAVRK